LTPVAVAALKMAIVMASSANAKAPFTERKLAGLSERRHETADGRPILPVEVDDVGQNEGNFDIKELEAELLIGGGNITQNEIYC